MDDDELEREGEEIEFWVSDGETRRAHWERVKLLGGEVRSPTPQETK